MRRNIHKKQAPISSLEVTSTGKVLHLLRLFAFYLLGGLGDSKIIGRDTRKMSKLHSWLHSRLQNQANSYWSLCYRASSHGWSGSTFHSYCDNRGPTVTIIRAHGYIFGGYTDQSWRRKFVNYHHFCKKT